MCEAPGAFVAALNHHLKCSFPELNWSWIATTLNPYYEGNPLGNMILDDRFMLHTLDNWNFGCDFTGNIMNDSNIKSLEVQCNDIGGKINLVTADGSIDCVESPEIQEEKVSALHMAEVVAALRILETGGSFILKMFTFFESSSVNLLYLLNCSFEQVNVFKPVTSKEGNSEVYVISMNFNGLDDHLNEILTIILENLENDEKSLFPCDFLPTDFIQQITECADFFMRHQTTVIENNIYFYQNESREENFRIKYTRPTVVEEYFMKYNLFSIDESKTILHGKDCTSFKNYNPRIHTGSHTERISLNFLSSEEKLKNLRLELKNFDANHLKGGNNQLMKLPNGNIFSFCHGKPIMQITSSKFIIVPILKCLMKIIQLTDKQNYENDVFYKTNDNGRVFELKIGNYFQIKNMDNFEKELINDIGQQILNSDFNEFRLKYFLVLTQFLAGFIYILASNVFDETIFSEYGEIVFRRRKTGGRQCIDGLLQMLKINRDSNSKSVLGLVKITNLCNGEFYDAIVKYNNFVCLKYCHMYLDL